MADSRNRNEASSSQRRAAVRVEVDRVPVQVWLSRLMAWGYVDGVLLNLSAGGALVRVDHPMAVGLDARCRFSLGENLFFSLRSTVVRCLRVGEAHELGMRFTFEGQTVQDRLVRWVFDEIARRHRSFLEKLETPPRARS